MSPAPEQADIGWEQQSIALSPVLSIGFKGKAKGRGSRHGE
jgi:hypothetical protein